MIRGRPNSTTSALDRAGKLLEARVDAFLRGEDESPQSARLPSLAALADMANVSRNTMWKAVGKAKSERLLRVTPGGFIEIVSEKKRATIWGDPSDNRGIISKKTRALLERELLSGSFGLSGKLPTTKELASRYGVCFRTMQKIVNNFVLSKDQGSRQYTKY